ncbi:hypothetical protein B0J17DRAFT_624751 [Rhizoctonia solani]|nr:hypothetical protein B0J17DRAFT_624751 [Rhizoctonia solani]
MAIKRREIRPTILRTKGPSYGHKTGRAICRGISHWSSGTSLGKSRIHSHCATYMSQAALGDILTYDTKKSPFEATCQSNSSLGFRTIRARVVRKRKCPGNALEVRLGLRGFKSDASGGHMLAAANEFVRIWFGRNLGGSWEKKFWSFEFDSICIFNPFKDTCRKVRPGRVGDRVRALRIPGLIGRVKKVWGGKPPEIPFKSQSKFNRYRDFLYILWNRR